MPTFIASATRYQYCRRLHDATTQLLRLQFQHGQVQRGYCCRRTTTTTTRPLRQRIVVGSSTYTSESDDVTRHYSRQQQQGRFSLLTSTPGRWYSSTTPSNQDEFTTTSSRSTPTSFAVVDHSYAYEQSMEGRHGRQLALALLEGSGKDDPPFDPFEDEEVMLQEYDDDDDEEEVMNFSGSKNDDTVVEAEIVPSKDKTGGEVDEKNYDSGYEEDSEEDDYYDDDDDTNDRYNPDGSIKRKKSTLATLRAGFPSGGLYAVLELAGSQHKVTKDDVMIVNKLKPVETYSVGSVHTFTDNVMLAGSSHMTLVGMPYVTGAEVDVMVEEITQDAKVVIFKKRRRKNSQRRNGYRRDVTLLRVLDVRLPAEYADHHHVSRDSVDELDQANSTSSSSILGAHASSFMGGSDNSLSVA